MIIRLDKFCLAHQYKDDCALDRAYRKRTVILI